MSSSDALLQALLTLNRVQALELLAAARAEHSPLEVIETLIRPALEQIGQLWEGGDCALSQIYMSGRICEELLEDLLGEVLEDDPPDPETAPPRLAIAVLEDYHLLGKQIVRTVLRAAGYQVRDYGRQDVETLVELVRSDGIAVLLVSTLMLPAALRVRHWSSNCARSRPVCGSWWAARPIASTIGSGTRSEPTPWD